MKYSLGISHFLEELSSHSLCIVFLFSFALIIEEAVYHYWLFCKFLVKKTTRLETNMKSKNMTLVLKKQIIQQNLKEGQMCQHVIVLSLKTPWKQATGIAAVPPQLSLYMAKTAM